jgi:hypothetical protein
MRVMQVPTDKIIDMISVRYRIMPAVGTMDVTSLVATALVAWGARIWIHGRNSNYVFFNLAVGKGMVQVAVVKVIDMSVVLDGRVATIGAMLMWMICVNVICHDCVFHLREMVKSPNS